MGCITSRNLNSSWYGVLFSTVSWDRNQPSRHRQAVFKYQPAEVGFTGVLGLVGRRTAFTLDPCSLIISLHSHTSKGGKPLSYGTFLFLLGRQWLGSILEM